MSRLASYHLKENPFEIFFHRHKMADRKEEWEKITRSLYSAFKERYPRIFILQADYGCGKTYMLEQLYLWVSKDREAAEKVFAVFVSPDTDILYGPRLSIMETEPRWRKFGLSLITRIFDNIEREKLVAALNKVSLIDLEKLKFGKVFKGLRNQNEAAFNYITGERLYAKDLKELGVSSPLSDSPTGLRLFFDFLKVIKSGGYSSFLLLVDEFEFITSVMGEKKITQILNTFREIFDTFGTYEDRDPWKLANPVFVFAISPGGWDKLEKLERDALKKTGGGGIVPFMERITKRDFIELRAFTLENTIELVKLRLSEARTKVIADSLFPFTQACIKYVHEVSRQKPRDVIQYCKILIDDASEEKLEKIDAKDAKRILGRYGIGASS